MRHVQCTIDWSVSQKIPSPWEDPGGKNHQPPLDFQMTNYSGSLVNLGESTDLLSLMSLGSLMTSGSCSQRVKYLGYCSIVGMGSGKFIQKRWGSGSLLGRGKGCPAHLPVSLFLSCVCPPQPVDSDLVRRGMNGPGRFGRALNSSLQSSA